MCGRQLSLCLRAAGAESSCAPQTVPHCLCTAQFPALTHTQMMSDFFFISCLNLIYTVYKFGFNSGPLGNVLLPPMASPSL